MVSAHRRHAWIRQADGVDHPSAELRDSWRGSTGPWLGAHRLRDETAERREIDDSGELVAVRRRAGSENDRILEGEAGRLDLERGAAGRHCRDTPPAGPPVPVATRRSYRLRYSRIPSAIAADSSSIR